MAVQIASFWTKSFPINSLMALNNKKTTARLCAIFTSHVVAAIDPGVPAVPSATPNDRAFKIVPNKIKRQTNRIGRNNALHR